MVEGELRQVKREEGLAAEDNGVGRVVGGALDCDPFSEEDGMGDGIPLGWVGELGEGLADITVSAFDYAVRARVVRRDLDWLALLVMGIKHLPNELLLLILHLCDFRTVLRCKQVCRIVILAVRSPSLRSLRLPITSFAEYGTQL